MSCQCEVEKKFSTEGIQLTNEEVQKFYELKTKEDALYHNLSNEQLAGLDNLKESKFVAYVKSLNEELAKALYNSNMFLMSLRKKYNCKDFFIEDDFLYPSIDK